MSASYSPKSQKYSPQIGWLVAALVVVLALLGYFVVDRYRLAQEAAATKTLNLVQLIESHVANDLARIDGVLAYLSNRINQPNQQQRLSDLQASFPMIAGLNVFDAQGMLIASSDPNIKGISIADRPHFQRLRDGPLTAGARNLCLREYDLRLGVIAQALEVGPVGNADALDVGV